MATINNNVLTFSGSLQHKRGTKEALEASDYVPAAGEIIVATDTGEIKAGDGSRTWSNLPSPDTTEIVNNYDEETTGKALDATKGKDLNDRVVVLEGITGIDCGEISASNPENSGDESCSRFIFQSREFLLGASALFILHGGAFMTIQNGVLKTSGVLQLKGGSAQNLTAANPLLARREIAVEIDTGKIKVGNGEDYWNDLPYTGSGGGGGTGGGTMIPSLVFSKTSIDLRLSSRKNTTFTVYTTSNGTISVRSTNPSVANASVNGNTVTVTAVSTGNANIIVDIASDGSYYGISDFISVEVLMGFRYGYRIKKNEPDPYERVEYLFDAVGLTPAHMDFDNGVFDYGDWRDKWFVTLNKPCMLKFDGTVDYYLNPNNYDEKEDGTASDVSNTSYEGNAMAQIPLCWVKRYEEDGYEYEIVSDVQFDDDYKAYAHTRSDGSIADFFYWSMFGASGDENKLRSLSGQSLAQNLTTENQIAGATANGDNWYIHSWCQRELIRTLLVLIGKSTDTQAVFGLGNCRTAGNSSGLLNTGTLNDKGQFFGFHSTSQQVKVFHIEKFWGDQWERTAGLINNKGTIFVKMTPEGEGYRVHDVNGYENTGITLNDSPSGYIRAGYISAFGFLPNNSNGSSSTYYCDYGYFEYSQLYYLFTGAGASTDSVRGGAFSFDVDGTPDTALWYIGCGLSCVPPATA